MTRAKLMWQALAAIGMVTALIAGGPQRVPARDGARIVGSDPVKELCNGQASNEADCDIKDCDAGIYEVIRAELPGTKLTGRYNNAELRCTTNGASSCKKYTLNSTTNCIEQLTPES